MTQLARTSRLFPEAPPLLLSMFDDDSFFNFDFPRWGNGFGSKVPAANVKENDSEYTIDLAAPGMKRDDFHIDIENGILSISSEKKEESEEKSEHFTRKEFSYSSFSRSFRLPESVNDEKINAKYDNGVLKIHLPKKEEAKKLSKKKEIKIG
jgi:HSP20 family protein